MPSVVTAIYALIQYGFHFTNIFKYSFCIYLHLVAHLETYAVETKDISTTRAPQTKSILLRSKLPSASPIA